MDCIFCKIANGEIPSKKIYEDDVVIVFLDINPISSGHMLVVPKDHTLDLETIDDEVLIHINKVIRKMMKLAYEKIPCDGITICQNNGTAQEVKHYHVHLIPRYKNDKLNFVDGIKDLDVDQIYEKLKQN